MTDDHFAFASNQTQDIGLGMCSICLEDIKSVPQRAIVVFSCFHKLHFDCAIVFIVKNIPSIGDEKCGSRPRTDEYHKVKCPICRGAIDSQTIDTIVNNFYPGDIVVYKTPQHLNAYYTDM